MPKIFAPNKQFNGESAGISFRDGEGKTTDPWRLQWFKEHGYKVVKDEKTEAQKEEKPEEKPEE